MTSCVYGVPFDEPFAARTGGMGIEYLVFDFVLVACVQYLKPVKVFFGFAISPVRTTCEMPPFRLSPPFRVLSYSANTQDSLLNILL